ncbi:MAG: dipeptide epimerase, partial [Flavobacteriales bacterium]|nr:dipeptide epimerase [Flavobacteriales bacterium]
VFGDESIRSKADLQAKRSLFGGVNIKLMKAGGLDRVAGLMHEARRNGQQVMLGSMSESSLGCTAMAHFAGAADVVDLDGPWLIKNDPFEGIRMTDSGGLRMPQDAGIGATLKADLDFIPVGA